MRVWKLLAIWIQWRYMYMSRENETSQILYLGITRSVVTFKVYSSVSSHRVGNATSFLENIRSDLGLVAGDFLDFPQSLRLNVLVRR